MHDIRMTSYIMHDTKLNINTPQFPVMFLVSFISLYMC